MRAETAPRSAVRTAALTTKRKRVPSCRLPLPAPLLRRNLPPRTRLWSLAWPLSGMEVITFAKELIITGFVGHIGPLELSALVLSQTLYNVTGNAP